MFEKATRLGLRFETIKGNISVEDLWSIPLTSKGGFSLDDIAKGLHRKIKDADEESFVEVQSNKNTELQLKFDIVKHIIKVKMTEAEERKLANDNAAKRNKIMDIIARKQDAALESMSVEELSKMI